MIIFVSSCQKGAEGNYIFIKKALEFPDSLSIILLDTSIISNSYINNNYDYESNQRIISFIKKYFKHDFKIHRDEIHMLVGLKFEDLYEIHDVILISLYDSTKKLHFIFGDEKHNRHWKLEDIEIIDNPRENTIQD